MHPYLLLLLLLLTATHIGSASTIPSRRYTSRGGSLQSRRWERMDGKVLQGRASSSSWSSSAPAPSLQSSLQSAVAGRACSVYLWDAPSALLHKWCHHLLKDCVYEGLGGRKFVRIEPGSILQLLYPCSRYSPDRCMVCGGSYRDHLTLWWAKHLYTPFDKSIDQMYARGSVLEPKYPPLPKPRNIYSSQTTPKRSPSSYQYNRNRKRPKQPRKRAPPPPSPPEMIRTFAFHRNYVTDLETLAPSSTLQHPNERTRKLRKELQKIQGSTDSRLEIRMLNDKKVAYVVPAEQEQQSFASKFARYVVLNAVDRLIGMQETENEQIRIRERSGNCCY